VPVLFDVSTGIFIRFPIFREQFPCHVNPGKEFAMRPHSKVTFPLLVGLFVLCGLQKWSLAAPAVIESARQIPVVAEVDVVVAGDSSAAVDGSNRGGTGGCAGVFWRRRVPTWVRISGHLPFVA
jgi:hypothetical protein